MILHAGFQYYELLPASEVPPYVLYFESSDEALLWLKDLAYQDSALVSRLRTFLNRYSGDPEYYRLTDHQAMERLSILLYRGSFVIAVRRPPAGGGKPTPATQSGAPAFPLSERSSRGPSDDTASTPADAPTFSSDLDGNAQAGALVAAAADGKPFCPE